MIMRRSKLINQPFLFKNEIWLDGKLVESILPFTGTEALEKYLKSIDEYYDEESIIVQETDISIDTDKKNIW